MSELTTAQRSKIRRLSQPKELTPDEEGGELNIVPFLDIIMNILIFVLATVAVTFTAIIDTTPAWSPVVAALAALRPGGRLVINAITKDTRDQSALLRLDYSTHLWKERTIQSVANVTRLDVREFLGAVGAWWPAIRATVSAMPLAAANDALVQLRNGAARGALALEIAS